MRRSGARGKDTGQSLRPQSAFGSYPPALLSNQTLPTKELRAEFPPPRLEGSLRHNALKSYKSFKDSSSFSLQPLSPTQHKSIPQCPSENFSQVGLLTRPSTAIPTSHSVHEVYGAPLKRPQSQHGSRRQHSQASVCPRCGYNLPCYSNQQDAWRAKSPKGQQSKNHKFKSESLDLEVALAERLQGLDASVGDTPMFTRTRRLQVFRSIFDEVIQRSRLYGHVLKMVKKEYDCNCESLQPESVKATLDDEEEARQRTASLLKQHSEALDECDELRAENERLRKEAQAITMKAAIERDAMCSERDALQRDAQHLRASLGANNERDADVQELAQVILAVKNGSLNPSQIVTSPAREGSAIHHLLQSERSMLDTNRTQDSSMSSQDVSWDVTLSSRKPAPRPHIVPKLPLQALEAEQYVDNDEDDNEQDGDMQNLGDSYQAAYHAQVPAGMHTASSSLDAGSSFEFSARELEAADPGD
eukprot:jgi/Chlat1/1442/Chrsp12S01995